MGLSIDGKTFTMIRPDDWHIHFRDGDMMKRVVPITAQNFGRAIVMPNLNPPITTAFMAHNYREEILDAANGYNFEPLMVLYLTNNITKKDIIDAKEANVVACKLYPAGATTNSDAGVTDIKKIYPALDEMQKQGLVLCAHGESTHGDILDREKIFISETLVDIRKQFPKLKIVFEHVTTQEAVNFVKETDNIAATITPQHLLLNLNDLFVGGLKPHYYCLPILKPERHQEALINAATSGDSKFFLGTDSAPHPKGAKESACGCAGCFNSQYALSLYMSVFEQFEALHKFEAFASINGCKFYGLPKNDDYITLEKVRSYSPSEAIIVNNDVVMPFGVDLPLTWQVKN